MGLAQLIKAFYADKNLPPNVRQIVLPDETNAIGTTLDDGGAGLTYGAWEDIALIAAVTEDTIVTAIVIDSPDANAATDMLTIDIGSTLIAGTLYANAAAVEAAGAGVVALASRCEVRLELASDAGIFLPIALPFPVYIPRSTGIIARFYDVASIGAPDQVNVSIIGVQLFK